MWFRAIALQYRARMYDETRRWSQSMLQKIATSTGNGAVPSCKSLIPVDMLMTRFLSHQGLVGRISIGTTSSVTSDAMN